MNGKVNVGRFMMTGQPTLHPPSHTDSGLLDNSQISGLLRLTGWINFGIQLTVMIGAGVLLLLAILSRHTVDNETQSFATGSGIFLAVLSVLFVGANAFYAFRYIRTAQRLNRSAAMVIDRNDLGRMLQVSLWIGLAGLLISLMGAEVSVAGLLTRTISQPQRTPVYDPEQFVRTLDVLVVLTNTSLAGAHLTSHVSSLWLSKRWR